MEPPPNESPQPSPEVEGDQHAASLVTWERILVAIFGALSIGFSVYGTLAKLPEVPITAFLLVGVALSCAGVLNLVPASLRVGDNEVTFRERRRRVLGDAERRVPTDPSAAVAAVDTVFAIDPRALDDSSALRQAAYVYEAAVLAALRSAVADPASVLDMHRHDLGVDALVSTPDGGKVAVTIKYSPFQIQTGTTSKGIDAARKMGATGFLLVENQPVRTLLQLQLAEAAGEELQAEIVGWNGGSADMERLERSLRNLGVETRQPS